MDGRSSPLDVQRRFLKFLLKIITFVNNWIDDRKLRPGAKHMAADWREYLGASQSSPRSEMYAKAIDPSPLEGFEDILNFSKLKADELQKRVTEFIESVSAKIKPMTINTEPAILFYFDEAHHLTKATVAVDGETKRTAYQCLCKAFTYMKRAPVFVLFLSTFSRLSKFAPSARNFWSSRLPPSTSEFGEVVDHINAPFVELPFDAWKEPNLVIEGTHSKEDICSLKFMARFGRPMFWALLETGDNHDAITLAMSKLRLRLEDLPRFPLEDPTKDKPPSYSELIPLLAARVDLTFESNRDEAVLLEGLLVASSMRTVYSVPQHRQYLRGGYPSEPFLAEAAARAMFEIITEGESEVTEKSIKEIIGKYKNISQRGANGD
ncbi:hypothetical protein C0995_013536 [Termitomyces sp. Mi166|nr:hypothetical protein C0995_013536 [Termitomyces sp. Mi166\